MSENNDRELYLNFDEYIRQGEPAQRERAEAWRVAIGLQAVDGLKVSDYLLELARKNIEGESARKSGETSATRLPKTQFKPMIPIRTGTPSTPAANKVISPIIFTSAA